MIDNKIIDEKRAYMTQLMKDKYYNYDSLYDLALRIRNVYPSFQVNAFIGDTMDETWEILELKARMRRITINLGKYLPANYQQAIAILNQVVDSYPIGYNDNSLIIFPDFIEVYGQDECNWDLSISALEKYTQISTAEFAVRPFIIKHEARMMQQMFIWSMHDNEHVRRLASEGCRPALPWGQALASFKNDPTPILIILEQLKADSSLYVRKSVANNLNDISKTHPDLVIEMARNWYGENEYTNWIVKHGCRTLLKKGNQEVLNIFGYQNADSIRVLDFSLESDSIIGGENIVFSFAVLAKETIKVRLEYGIDYVKANGKHNRKIFQISDVILKENEKKIYTKRHSFRDLSSRIHYPGVHFVILIVNGVEKGTLDFELKK